MSRLELDRIRKPLIPLVVYISLAGASLRYMMSSMVTRHLWKRLASRSVERVAEIKLASKI